MESENVLTTSLLQNFEYKYNRYMTERKKPKNTELDPIKMEEYSIENESVDSTIERMLRGDFIDKDNIHMALIKVCTAIDDLTLIPVVIKNILLKEIDLQYREDVATQEEEDRLFKPVTTEFYGDRIIEHPDARDILLNYLHDLFLGLSSKLRETGAVDEETDDHDFDQFQFDFFNKGNTSELLEKYIQEVGLGNPLADYVKHWKIIIDNMLEKAPKRDYQKERLEIAHKRWKEGKVNFVDYNLYLADMINYTADPVVIKKLIESSLKRIEERVILDTPNEEPPYLEEILSIMMSEVNEILRKEPDNEKALGWHSILNKMMKEKNILYDPIEWEDDDDDDDDDLMDDKGDDWKDDQES